MSPLPNNSQATHDLFTNAEMSSGISEAFDDFFKALLWIIKLPFYAVYYLVYYFLGLVVVLLMLVLWVIAFELLWFGSASLSMLLAIVIELLIATLLGEPLTVSNPFLTEGHGPRSQRRTEGPSCPSEDAEVTTPSEGAGESSRAGQGEESSERDDDPPPAYTLRSSEVPDDTFPPRNAQKKRPQEANGELKRGDILMIIGVYGGIATLIWSMVIIVKIMHEISPKAEGDERPSAEPFEWWILVLQAAWGAFKRVFIHFIPIAVVLVIVTLIACGIVRLTRRRKDIQNDAEQATTLRQTQETELAEGVNIGLGSSLGTESLLSGSGREVDSLEQGQTLPSLSHDHAYEQQPARTQ